MSSSFAGSFSDRFVCRSNKFTSSSGIINSRGGEGVGLWLLVGRRRSGGGWLGFLGFLKIFRVFCLALAYIYVCVCVCIGECSNENQ
ncbi:hypothetical protein Hdeb2414_s0634g00927501 [Helianthus debilis subsp. tardiflorus]